MCSILCAKKLDTFYIDLGLKDNYGYIRTVVTRFEKGSTPDTPPPTSECPELLCPPDMSYVKAIVQHQFRPDSSPTLASFQEYHKGLMQNAQGKLNYVNDVPQLEVSSTAWGPLENSLIKRKQKTDCS